MELMSSRAHGSEEQLATLALAGVGVEAAPSVMIGGLGMGFTLRAALDRLGAQARVVVVELSLAVTRWCRGPLAELSGHSLDDPRVSLVVGDVAAVLEAREAVWDAIVLDVDNGPDAVSVPGNEGLYSVAGLSRAAAALTPGGVLAVWSAGSSPRFVRAARGAGLRVEERLVTARSSPGGPEHAVYLAFVRSGPLPGIG